MTWLWAAVFWLCADAAFVVALSILSGVSSNGRTRGIGPRHQGSIPCAPSLSRGWCNGSTAGSDPADPGSSPGPRSLGLAPASSGDSKSPRARVGTSGARFSCGVAELAQRAAVNREIAGSSPAPTASFSEASNGPECTRLRADGGNASHEAERRNRVTP